MNLKNAQIIIPKPAYIANSYKWYLGDCSKGDDASVKREICDAFQNNISNGRILVNPVEELLKSDLTFIDGTRQITPVEDEVYVQNPYNHKEYFSAGCAIEKMQRLKLGFYKILLQKLGARKVYKKVASSDSTKETTEIGGGIRAEQRSSQKGDKEGTNEKKGGGINADYKRELENALKEDYWENLTFGEEGSPSTFSKENWENAKKFIFENNLQYDQDFTDLLEQRNPDNPNLLQTMTTHYHCKRDCSAVMDLGIEIDVAKVALGFNPATKILNKFLKLSIELDFHYKTTMSRIFEQSIDVEIEF